jgi:DNA-binding MarR family transcriptional regulator
MPSTSEPQATGALEMTRIVKGARGLLSGAVLDHLRASGAPDLRAAHQQVFESLDAEGSRVTVLADRAGMSHQAMGELVAELVGLGYLERIADPDDGRSRRVRPTAAGRALIESGRQYLDQVRADWDRALGDGLGVDDVLDALTKLAGVLTGNAPGSSAGSAIRAATPSGRPADGRR